MEYYENVLHHLYRPLVRNGLGFGAQRWMATLQRQSEFLAMLMSSVDTPGDHHCAIFFDTFEFNL